MNENPILPARIYFFFPPLLYPKIFPPPTYHLPTPPPPHSIARAPETSSGSELGAGELGGELGAGAWSNELGAGEWLEPERDPRESRSGTQVSILLFFLSFILFVCLWSCFAAQLHKICYALQRNSTRYFALCSTAPQDTLHCSAT
jgi:hypothetical protein